MYSQIPTDVIKAEMLKNLSFQDLLKFRSVDRKSNSMVLEFLKQVWLPQMYRRLESIKQKIEYSYGYLFTGGMSSILRSPDLRKSYQEAKEFMDELNHAITTTNTIISEMLHAFKILSLNSFAIKDINNKMVQVSPSVLATYPKQLNVYKDTADRLLSRLKEMMWNNPNMEFPMYEIEHMAGSRSGRRQMTADQKLQILAAINDCLASREHTRGARGSTQGTHEAGMARRKADKWNRAQRIFQSSGFAAALNDARRC